MKNKINRFWVIVAALLIAVSIYSLAPTVVLYLRKSPPPYTNAQAIEKLKGKSGEFFSFIVFSDNHAGFFFDDSETLKMIRRINREDRFKKIPFDFVVAAGDVTFQGSEWDYIVYNKIRSLIKWPVISAVGNHDKERKATPRFKKYAGEAEFAFADRNSYFIFVDNALGDISNKQFAKIEEQLKASLVYKHRFIIMHKPPVAPAQQSWYRPELNSWSYRFMKLCEQYNVDIVFCGHEHMFKEMRFGQVRYIVAGGGGGMSNIPTPEGGFFHYIVVKVYGDYVDYEVRRIFPPVWEYLTYYMWKDVFYFLKDALF